MCKRLLLRNFDDIFTSDLSVAREIGSLNTRISMKSDQSAGHWREAELKVKRARCEGASEVVL